MDSFDFTYRRARRSCDRYRRTVQNNPAIRNLDPECGTRDEYCGCNCNWNCNINNKHENKNKDWVFKGTGMHGMLGGWDCRGRSRSEAKMAETVITD